MTPNYSDTAADKTAVNNRRNFLQQSKLSRLPKLPARASDVLAQKSASVCVNCRSNLKNESEFARRISVCAACLAIYSKIDDAITRANESRAYSIFGDK